MQTLAIYPGSFDPVTNGHLDILQRATMLFDRVVVAIAHNVNKQGLFTPDERADLLRTVIGDNDKVEVDVFEGLLIDYARRRGARSIVRGLRAVADFDSDGFVDLLVDDGSPLPALHLGAVGGGFVDVGARGLMAPVVPVDTVDLELDGDLDLVFGDAAWINDGAARL